MHLCVRTPKDRRKSVWAKWHEAGGLKDITKSGKTRATVYNREPSQPHQSVSSQLLVSPKKRKANEHRAPAPTSPAASSRKPAPDPGQSVQPSTPENMTSDSEETKNEISNLPCASVCGKPPFLRPTDFVHVCNICSMPMYA